jgi:hypothetical protein
LFAVHRANNFVYGQNSTRVGTKNTYGYGVVLTCMYYSTYSIMEQIERGRPTTQPQPPEQTPIILRLVLIASAT